MIRFEESVDQHIKNGNWGALSNTYYEQYLESKKSGDVKSALVSLLTAVYYALTGMENRNRCANYDSLKWIFETRLWLDISRCSKKLGLSETDLTELFSNAVNQCITKPPFSYFNTDTMIQIILDRLKSQSNLLEKYKPYANTPKIGSKEYYYYDNTKSLDYNLEHGLFDR